LLRPCTIQKNGTGTIPNPHSWNTHANIVFLDQPVGAGFSYADGGLPATPLTPARAAKDVLAFLELFLRRFDKYASAPLHLAGESWAGHFIPHIASTIYARNLALQSRINLASVGARQSTWLLWEVLTSKVADHDRQRANGSTSPVPEHGGIPVYRPVCVVRPRKQRVHRARGAGGELCSPREEVLRL
jgi:hypothetical protein